MVKGTFDSRVDALSRRVGQGTLRVQVEVNQRYAETQHRRTDYRHPRGGQAGYLAVPLVGRSSRYIRGIAQSALRPGGLPRVMKDIGRDLVKAVEVYAPLDAGDLRRSGSYSVFDRQTRVAHVRARRQRLSDRQLRIKARRRRGRR